MTTPRDAIAGLSERLRSRARRLYGDTRYGNDFDAAATAIDALRGERDSLQARVKELERDNGIFRDMQCDVLEQAWAAESRALRAEQERDEAVERLKTLAEAKALSGVRKLVAGWNGEGRSDGPYTRHRDELGATLPKTNCGAIYQLDDAMTAARDLVRRLSAGPEKEKQK